MNSHNSLALEHINSGNPKTSEVINSVLLNQKVYRTRELLDKLLALPTVNFYLPITDKIILLIRVVNKKTWINSQLSSGICFFTQYSDKKYVCYSNYLAKRFKQYLKKNALFNNKDTGIL